MKQSAEQSDALVLPSHAAMYQCQHWCDASQLHNIPNGLEIKGESVNFIHKQKKIIYVGRLEYGLKRVDRFIRIWAQVEKQHPNWSADIGILIGDKQYRQGGRGTDAVRQMLSYAFGELGLHRITALILEENTASRRTFSKLGFTEEGMCRDSVFKGGKYRNQVVVSLLVYEYFNNNI